MGASSPAAKPLSIAYPTLAAPLGQALILRMVDLLPSRVNRENTLAEEAASRNGEFPPPARSLNPASLLLGIDGMRRF